MPRPAASSAWRSGPRAGAGAWPRRPSRSRTGLVMQSLHSRPLVVGAEWSPQTGSRHVTQLPTEWVKAPARRRRHGIPFLMVAPAHLLCQHCTGSSRPRWGGIDRDGCMIVIGTSRRKCIQSKVRRYRATGATSAPRTRHFSTPPKEDTASHSFFPSSHDRTGRGPDTRPDVASIDSVRLRTITVQAATSMKFQLLIRWNRAPRVRWTQSLGSTNRCRARHRHR